LYLDALEKLLLLRMIAGLLALPVVIWWQLKRVTVIGAFEIVPDQIKRASTLTWKACEPDSDENQFF